MCITMNCCCKGSAYVAYSNIIKDDLCLLQACIHNHVCPTKSHRCVVGLQGGAFYFLEHVVAEPSSWTYFCQHVLQPMWYYFGDGCMLTRATWTDLEAAGFSELKLRHIEAPLTFLIKPHIVGYAVK